MAHQESSVHSRTQRLSVLGAIRRSLVPALVVFAASQAWAFQTTSGGGASRTGGATSSGGNAPINAPEINPALVAGAVVLLVGGLLILTSRRRKAAKA